jgi:hypothetical protein
MRGFTMGINGLLFTSSEEVPRDALHAGCRRLGALLAVGHSASFAVLAVESVAHSTFITGEADAAFQTSLG